MENDQLEILLLHKYPKFLQQCCDLINDEWPRSETARMMSLKASCDTLPTSLILVQDKKIVIGHCKLTPIPSIRESCFVETVVISKAMRGKKLGSYLMKKVEEYCKKVLKLSMIHLSTKGQENFYAKLGYVVCAPISLYGCNIPSISISTSSHKIENHVPQINSIINGDVPPPPPPPPMPKTVSNNPINNSKSNKTYMFKNI